MKKELTVFAAAIALAAGAFEWDFTKGMPEGGRPRACAVLGPNGLSPSQIARNVTGKDAAGVMFPKIDLPAAFTFEAVVVPFVAWTNEADRAAATSSRSMHVFDTMAVNYKPKCRDKGLQVMFQQSGERWTAVLYAVRPACAGMPVVAALGGEIPVPTPEGEAQLKIPAGTANGKVFRLRGKGVPSLRGGMPGDLDVRVVIEVPVRLDRKQRAALEEFQKLATSDLFPEARRLADKTKVFLSHRDSLKK